MRTYRRIVMVAWDRWIAGGFAIGSVCFFIGPFPGFQQLVGPGAVGVVFFAGSIFFTLAAGLALREGGVGSALMHAVLGAADALEEPLVALLGHTEYYPRFGFRPAAELGVDPPVEDWAPHFQVRTLGAYSPGLRGVFRYAPAFNDL